MGSSKQVVGHSTGQLGVAERLMREHRFGEAIDHLRRRRLAEPDDTKALLQLGICHLLNRSEEEFCAIYRQAARLMAHRAAPAPEVSRLWGLYRSLAAKLSTTALVVTTAAGVGCDRSGSTPDVGPAASTSPIASTAEVEAAPEVQEPAPESSAGASAEPPVAPASSADATSTSTAATAPTTTAVRPAHRYSGGVRPPTPKSPAHRYSGGVLRQ